MNTTLCSVSLSLLVALVPDRAGAVMVTEGLSHLWHLDEITGSAAVDSVGSADLQLVGNAALGAPGIDGTGVLLDGSDAFLRSAPGTADYLTSDFTVSLWMRWLFAPGKPGILQFAGIGIDLTYADLKPVLFLGYDGRTTSSKSIGDHQWHLLSAIWDGDTAFLYLDAEQVGSGPASFLIPPPAITSFQFGKYDATHFFGGVIDEVAIYNRALSPAEVAANAVPEPRSVLLLVGMGGLLAAARRRPFQRCRPAFSARPRNTLTHQLLAIAVIALMASPTPAAITALDYYRMGDADPGAVAGNIGNSPTIDSAGTSDLMRNGRPAYSSSVPFFTVGGASNALSLSFDAALTDGYAFSSRLTDAQDGFGIEAFVAASSAAGNAGIVYNGKAGSAGFGCCGAVTSIRRSSARIRERSLGVRPLRSANGFTWRWFETTVSPPSTSTAWPPAHPPQRLSSAPILFTSAAAPAKTTSRDSSMR